MFIVTGYKGFLNEILEYLDYFRVNAKFICVNAIRKKTYEKNSLIVM